MHVGVVLAQDAEAAAPARHPRSPEPAPERRPRSAQLVVLRLQTRHAEAPVDLVADDERIADALPLRAAEPVVVQREHERDAAPFCPLEDAGREADQVLDVDDVRSPLLEHAVVEGVDARVLVDAREAREVREEMIEPPHLERALPPRLERVVGLRRVRLPGEHPDRVRGGERGRERVTLQLHAPHRIRGEAVHDVEDAHQTLRAARSLARAPRYWAVFCTRVQAMA